MRYHEEQHFTQWWVWVLVLGVAAVTWWAFIQQILMGRSFGDNPAPNWAVALIWVIIGLGLPLTFEALKLVVEVRNEEVLVRFRPMHTRSIPISAIAEVEARKYNAVKEYGGWGIKGWSGKKIAYNVKGSWGVDLVLTDGRRILIGTQKPQELAAAIEDLVKAGKGTVKKRSK